MHSEGAGNGGNGSHVGLPGVLSVGSLSKSMGLALIRLICSNIGPHKATAAF